MLATVRRLCGHDSGGPTGVLRQSKERIKAPKSPPPFRQLTTTFSELILKVARHSEIFPTSMLIRLRLAGFRYRISCKNEPNLVNYPDYNRLKSSHSLTV